MMIQNFKNSPIRNKDVSPNPANILYLTEIFLHFLENLLTEAQCKQKWINKKNF